MKRLSLDRYALSAGVAIALLAGCGESQQAMWCVR
jgi:hypothetical protein